LLITRPDNNVLSTIVGIEQSIGPDEDDFHIIGRRKQELDREDRRVEKVQRSMDVRVGAQSGTVQPVGKPSNMPKKKVVHF
jgi:zinc finger CCHC domain-containing protein 9